MRQTLTRPCRLRYTPALATNPTIPTRSAKPNPPPGTQPRDGGCRPVRHPRGAVLT